MAVGRMTRTIEEELTHMRTIARKTAQVLVVAAPLAFLIVETAYRGSGG